MPQKSTSVHSSVFVLWFLFQQNVFQSVQCKNALHTLKYKCSNIEFERFQGYCVSLWIFACVSERGVFLFFVNALFLVCNVLSHIPAICPITHWGKEGVVAAWFVYIWFNCISCWHAYCPVHGQHDCVTTAQSLQQLSTACACHALWIPRSASMGS